MQARRFQENENKLMAYNKEAGMQQQAKQAGEKLFFAEFKRGIETVGLMLTKENVPVQQPQISENVVKDLIREAQQDTAAYPRGINMIASRKKAEIASEAAEKGIEIRLEYVGKLNAILGPEYSDRVASLNGTIFKENLDQTLGPEKKKAITKLNDWRANEMAVLAANRDAETKKADAWKDGKLTNTKDEVELDCLVKRTMDLYGLEGEQRTRLEPTIKVIIKEARSTANQAYRAESDAVYKQLKDKSPTEG